MNIEPLESRIAPALAFPTATSATFTDVDGDLVTVKVSKGLLVPGDFDLGPANALGGQLFRKLDFSNDGITFDNASVTITAQRTDLGGDGRVNLGYLNSLGHDLGAVKIAGDLGRIDAGETAMTPLGLKSLTVQSLGRFALTTQDGGDLMSDVVGSVSALTVAGDIVDAAFQTTGGITTIKVTGSIFGGDADHEGSIRAMGAIGSVTVGDSIVGGLGNFSGRIRSEVSIGSVKIGGSIVGGGGEESGAVVSFGKMGAVAITGSLLGGDGVKSGSLNAGDDAGAIRIGGDLRGGSMEEAGEIKIEGAIASLKISGSLEGGTADFTGRVRSAEKLGSVSIGGSVLGGGGEEAGSVRSFTSIGNVSIIGSLVGGDGNFSGRVDAAETIGAVKIARDVTGGAGDNSGQISAGGLVSSVSVGGSLTGGAAEGSGTILAGALGVVKITANVAGGSVSGLASLDFSGAIATQGGRIGSVSIGGSIFAGIDDSTGTLTRSGAIVSELNLGTVTVKGSLVGSVGPGGDVTPVRIEGFGQAIPTATANLAIKSVNVTGRVERAEIIAGGPVLGVANPDAQIGTVIVGGDWIASSISAGVDSGDNGFGNTGDVIFATGTDTGVNSRIASILIKGQALGTLIGGDHFGFVAQQIGSFKIGTTAFPLQPAAGDDLPPDDFAVGVTDDLRVREVAV